MIKKNYVNISEAILRINPNAYMAISTPSDGSTETIEWLRDTPEISREDIDAKIVELEAEWDAQEYARNRKAEYPDWGTQLNKIYDDGIEKWKTEMVDPIKAKYPK